ncbi:MAG: ribonuclease P protein component [Chloroflexota bacterium]
MNRRYRLRRTQDFARLRQEGRTARHPLLSVSAAPNALPHNRYGFITGRRLGKAVVRSRARRRMQEAVRLLHPRLEQGYDVVFIGRPAVIEAAYAAVAQAVEQTLRRVALFVEDDEETNKHA